jgi:O-succinylhomoserine sulfhydrylase
MSKNDTGDWRARTQAVRGGLDRTHHGETAEALFLTSGYAYASAEQAEARFREEEAGHTYSRFSNPTVVAFETRMALLEGAEAAHATATGMAAVTACLLSQLSAGDHLVAARALFGSCLFVIQNILPRFGITSTIVDGRDLDAWRNAMQPNTKLLFLETPSNPTLEIVDLAAVAEIAHAQGARVVVDNVFATPILQRPMEFGADIVIYSATKHIDGQGRCLGGIVLGPRDYIEGDLRQFLRQTGPCLSPFNAWVMLKALETLELRIEAHCRNAARIAGFLARAGGITRVLYPGREDHPQFGLACRQMSAGGGIVAFEVKGGKAGAFRFANALDLIDISNNLGDAKSLITHPATTTHHRLSPAEREALGISDGLLRLSVGLEDADDIAEDLARGLAALRKAA